MHSYSYVAEPSEPDKREYMWVDCRSRGWQVLMAAETLNAGVPEPPECVINRPDNVSPSKTGGQSISKTRRNMPHSPSRLHPKPWQTLSDSEETRALSPKPVDSKENSSGSNRSPLSSGPKQRNFLIENRESNRPLRKSKRDLLDEASRQLKASELIGSSLAERLSGMHSQVN